MLLHGSCSCELAVSGAQQPLCKASLIILTPLPRSGRRSELSSAFPGVAHTRSLRSQLHRAEMERLHSVYEADEGLSAGSEQQVILLLQWGSSLWAAPVTSLCVPVGLDPQLFPAFRLYSPSCIPQGPPHLPELTVPVIPHIALALPGKRMKSH